MRRRNISCLKWAAMAALAIAPCAGANTLYTYIGNPFTTIVGTPGVPDKYNTSDFIEVMLTTVNPLPVNMSVMTPIDPTQIVSFQITDGVEPGTWLPTIAGLATLVVLSKARSRAKAQPLG